MNDDFIYLFYIAVLVDNSILESWLLLRFIATVVGLIWGVLKIIEIIHKWIKH